MSFVFNYYKLQVLFILYFHRLDNQTNSLLAIVEISDLSFPINQCCLFYNKLERPLSPQIRLGAQITYLTVLDQDLIDFISSKYIIYKNIDCSEEEGQNSQNVNMVAVMRSYLRSTLNPLLNYFKRNDSDDNNGTFMFIMIYKLDSSISKKVADLDMALANYEQNLDIPEVQLYFPQFLIEAANTCRAAGHLLSINELGWDTQDIKDLENQLLSIKSQWVKEIHRLTNHTRDVKQGTSLQEVNYWNVLSKSCETLLQRLDVYEVQLLFHTLKSQHLIVSANILDNVRELQQKLEESKRNSQFLNTIPIETLITSNDLASINSLIPVLFTKLKQIKNNRYYPVPRFVDFVYVISVDVTRKCISLLENQRIMNYPYDKFTSITQTILSIFKSWNNECPPLWHTIREFNKEFRFQFKFEFKELEERIQIISDFRTKHEEYIQAIQQVFTYQENSTLLNKVNSAYEPFHHYMIVDFTPMNLQKWQDLIEEYNHHLEQLDQDIVDIIHEKLNNVHTTDQMYAVFRKFGLLFFRPRINSSVQQYKASLIDQCKKDIESLKNMVDTASYIDSESYRISKMHDIPKLAGSVIWARQIENRLNLYIERVQLLLGQYWEKQQDGKYIHDHVESIRNHVDCTKKIEKWTEELKEKLNQKLLRNVIFSIKRGITSSYSIVINYDEQYFTCFKEVRSLDCLGIRVPVTIRLECENIKMCYSNAIAIRSALSTYSQLIQTTDHTILELASFYHQQVRDLIATVINEKLTWESKKLAEYFFYCIFHTI